MSAPDDSYRSYSGLEQPVVVVEVDGVLHDGVLRAWSRRDDGWWGHVVYRRDGDNYPATLPAVRITQVPSCPWFRGHSRCLFECERGVLLDE